MCKTQKQNRSQVFPSNSAILSSIRTFANVTLPPWHLPKRTSISNGKHNTKKVLKNSKSFLHQIKYWQKSPRLCKWWSCRSGYISYTTVHNKRFWSSSLETNRAKTKKDINYGKSWWVLSCEWWVIRWCTWCVHDAPVIVGKGGHTPLFKINPCFYKILPSLEIQDPPTFYRLIGKTKVLNNSSNPICI